MGRILETVESWSDIAVDMLLMYVHVPTIEQQRSCGAISPSTSHKVCSEKHKIALSVEADSGKMAESHFSRPRAAPFHCPTNQIGSG